MFRFLKAMRVRRSYLWISVLLFEMLGSGWLNMKVACIDDAEHPEQSNSSLSNPIIPTPTAQTPPYPIPPEPTTIPSQLAQRLVDLSVIRNPHKHTWMLHRTQYNTFQWLLTLNPEQTIPNNDPALGPTQYIIAPRWWKESDYNSCYQDLAPLQRIVSTRRMEILDIELKHGRTALKLLRLLLHILDTPRLDVYLNRQPQHSKDPRFDLTHADVNCLFDDLPEGIRDRRTYLCMQLPNTADSGIDILWLAIQAYEWVDLTLRSAWARLIALW
ncbi:hypothetical protein NEHOM01_1914 [Nematocida homosporus]|uniref:uncharacterized protein n=1 Tax=Nematocida homosporus TaxID=1912981 RepID=UPI00222038CC|nr:uncharacterized protein NEHOM01_1914 [Nematocida homosporus]KAI5187081.1 hypothetical protein NEHOM01_1914 [Nematocida homosporus]